MRIRSILIALGGLALIVGGWWVWQISIAADVGAAAMAKVTCSCVFVEQRSLESCRADDPPGFEDIPVTIDQAAKSATGSLFGVIKRTATFDETYGCTLEP